MAPYWVRVHDCGEPFVLSGPGRHSREWFSLDRPGLPGVAGGRTCQLKGVAASTDPLLSEMLITGSSVAWRLATGC